MRLQTPNLRQGLVQNLSYVTLISLILMLCFGMWYWDRIPDEMKANSSVAVLTQQFMSWHYQFYLLLGTTVGAFFVISIGGICFSSKIPRIALLIPTFMGIWLLSHFERSREFMRKPWVIGEYLYSTGIRKDELEFFQKNGILKYATFVSNREVTEDNMISAGKDVFTITCSKCHSTTGLNGIVEKFTNLYGDKSWDDKALKAFISSMHASRTFMPPFPGNNDELTALVAYIKDLQVNPKPLLGAQEQGALLPKGESSVLKFSLQEGEPSSNPNEIFVENGVILGR